jgi:hypothetical protein
LHPSRRRRLTGNVLALITVFAASLGGPVGVLATAGPDVTIQLITGTMWNSYTVLEADVVPQPNTPNPAQGTIKWFEVTGGGDVQFGESALELVNGNHSQLTLPTGMPLGSHTIYAVAYIVNEDPSTSPALTFEVTQAGSNVDLSGPALVETKHSFQLSGNLTSNAVSEPTGTLSFWRVGDASPICAATTPTGTIGTCTVGPLTAGSYDFIAKYSGTTGVQASESNVVTVNVVPDVVHAHSVGVAYTAFYPVIDSYRDVLGIRGVRDEAASVLIRIYNSSNTLVKSASFAGATGSYLYNWNGRNTAGTILPEGTYRVLQLLKDGTSTTLYVTSYVTLSKKHLIYHTTSVTKLGSSITTSGHQGGGTVSLNTTSGYVKLNAPTPYYDWAGAGWQFALPTATLYKSIAFRVYAKHAFYTGPSPRFGAQNFAVCPYASGTWYEDCFDAWHTIPNSSTLAWYTTGSLTSAHRYGRTVRGLVSNDAGATYVYKAQVVVTYATLGY